MSGDKNQPLVPRLRFPQFQETREWEERELGSLTTKVGSGITPRGGDKNYKTEGRPFIRSQNVGWGELLLENVAFIDEETHRSFNSTEIKDADVLLNITGASIGRSAVADMRIVGANVNQHVCIIRVIRSKLNPILLNQFLISELGQKQIDSFQAGGNRQGLNFAQIRSLNIPLPSTDTEQQKIADCLSSLDERITAEASKLDTLKAHKKGLMQQLFPAEGETVPRLRFPEFREAGEWLHFSFRSLELDVSDGNYSSKYPKQSDFQSSGIPFLRANNLHFGTVSDNDMRFISEKQHQELRKGHLREGDILLSTRGEIGMVALVPKRHIGSNINAQLVRINTIGKIGNEFLFQLLDYFRAIGIFDSIATGTALKQLPIGKLNQLTLIVPGQPREQQKIADCLSSLDDLITAQTQKIDLLKRHKKGLMQQLFPVLDEEPA